MYILYGSEWHPSLGIKGTCSNVLDMETMI